MKKLKIFASLCVILSLVACNDDLGVRRNNYSDGLYFHFSSNDWSTNGSKSTRVVSIQDMESSEQLDQPLYLHCEVTEGIFPTTPQDTSQAQTRAVRYTGPVFNDSYGVTSFGIYGTVGTKTAFDGNEVFTRDELTGYDNGSQGSPSASKSWREKENQTINEYWGDDETGDFYGFAPSPYEGGGSVNSCISVDFSGTPTLTYDMPADAADQRDVLTADRTSVSKAYKNEFGIELEFCHVLSALRFKVAYDAEHPENSLKWSIQGTTYYVQPKKIDINDIYSKGSCEIKTELSNLSTHWTRLKADSSDDDYKKCALTTCTINDGTSAYNRTRGDIITDQGLITPDANCFMVLPQLIKDGVKAVIWCDLYTAVDGSGNCTGTPAKTNVRIEAPLSGKLSDGASDPWDEGGDGSLAWCPGYTYTYTLSDIDVAYVFDYMYDVEKDYTVSAFSTETAYSNVPIRSYKISKDTKTLVGWKILNEQTPSTVNEDGTIGTSGTPTWVDGAHGWIHVIDANGSGSEVTTTHTGALDESSERLFQIKIDDIMDPIIDLSLYNHDQTKKWTGRTTSNCYIVAGPGKYRIPLVYGNAVQNGQVNQLAYMTSAKIDGTENPGPINPLYYLSYFRNHKDQDITSPYINLVAYHEAHHAALVWEEVEGLITVENDLDFSTTTDDDDYNKAEEGFLVFSINPGVFNYGNAVVAVCDKNDNIMWSWHIWITDPATFLEGNVTLNTGFTYASTNIGWVDAADDFIPAKTRSGKVKLVQDESGKSIEIHATQTICNTFKPYFTNVLYQWGRKDPLRGILPGQNDTNDGTPRASTGIQAWENKYGSKATIGEMIQHPNWIYGVSAGDLYKRPSSESSLIDCAFANQWGTDCAKYKLTYNFYGKTIYDPSPVGYCVPPSKAVSKLSINVLSYRPWEDYGDDTDKLPIKCKYTEEGTGNVVYFPCSGSRSTDGTNGLKASGMGEFTGSGTHLTRGGTTGYFLTASPYSKDENRLLHIAMYKYRSYTVVGQLDTHYRKAKYDNNLAGSVLPVVYPGQQIDTTESDDNGTTE